MLSQMELQHLQSLQIPSESSQFSRVLPKCVNTFDDHEPYPISPLYSSAEVKHKIKVFGEDCKLWQNKIHEHLRILDESLSFGSDVGKLENTEFHENIRQIQQHLQKVLFNLSETQKMSKKIGEQQLK